MNKRINFNLLASIAICTIIFSNCKKEEEDKSAPVVNITLPVSTQMYNSGDTVKIKGTVTDNEMHEMLIEIRNDANDSILYSETPSVHDLSSYVINTFWKSKVSTHTNATIKVSVEDHAGNNGTATAKIQIMP